MKIAISEEFSVVLTATKGEEIAYAGDDYAPFRDKYANAYAQEFKVSKRFEDEYIVVLNESTNNYKILYPAKYNVVEIDNDLIVVTEEEAFVNNLKDVTLKLDRRKLEQTGIVSWSKDVLTEIIEKIKEANEMLSKNKNVEHATISEDQDNETIREILAQYNIEDDEDDIAEKLGVDALHMIRDAEAGMY